jgi:amidohydrolase
VDIASVVERTADHEATIARALAVAVDDVVALSKDLFAHPELSYEEHHAARVLSDYLERSGLTVARGVGGLPTAFTAEAGSGEFVVGLCVEYDALPEVGHACGHNLIAGASVGAAVALLPAVEELGIRLKVIGTPAEEHGGGKVDLLRAGLFDDLDVAMMVHMMREGQSYNPVGTSSQLVGRFRAVFRGRESHAANAPHLGVNAGDAAVIAQVAVGLLRQQVPSDHRLSAVTLQGGTVTNIIPGRAIVDFECRAWTRAEYDRLLVRVEDCFRAGALATGATLEITPTEHLLDALRQDELLCSHWARAIGSLGRDVTAAEGGLAGGSTDMGNVSQYLPSIHPFIGIPGATAAPHTFEFAAHADSDPAYEVMVESALALAWTAASLATTAADRDSLIAARRSRPPFAG